MRPKLYWTKKRIRQNLIDIAVLLETGEKREAKSLLKFLIEELNKKTK